MYYNIDKEKPFNSLHEYSSIKYNASKRYIQCTKQTDWPQKKSRFIADALRKSIEKIRQERLEKLLEEGYKATSQEGQLIAKEFESSDLEKWDEIMTVEQGDVAYM